MPGRSFVTRPEVVYKVHAMLLKPTQRLLWAAILTAWIAGSPDLLLAAEGPHAADIVKIEDLTRDVKRIRFKAQEPGRFRFNAGQFVLLHLPEPYLNEFNQRHGTSHTDVARPYSFASSPSE